MKLLKVLASGAMIAALATVASCKKDDEKKKDTTNVHVSINYMDGDTHYGITYQGSTATKDMSDATLTKGTMLPTWKAFAENLGLSLVDSANYTKSYGDEWDQYNKEGFIDTNGNQIDLMMCDGKASATAANAGKLMSITKLLDEGKLPNFKKWLETNDATGSIMGSMKSTDGEVYYTPYFDGLNNVEKMLQMNVEMVEKLLDEETPTFDTTNAKTSNFKAQVPAWDEEVIPVTAADGKTATTIKVTIPANKNIITQQNAIDTKNGATYTQALRDYIDEVYADYLGEGKLYSKRSEIFTSVSACYNADELVALFRCVQNNPRYLTGGDTIYAFAPRAAAANRQISVLALASMWGVRGLVGEKGQLYFGNDGKLVDGRTQKNTYDAIDNLHELYTEGMFPDKYYAGLNGDTANDTYRKTLLTNGTLFSVYDFNNSTNFNSDVTSGSKTNKLEAVLPAVAKWDDGNDSTGYFHYTEDNRSLKTGGWAIMADTDNLDDACKLMDYIWTDEGADIQDYGPNTTAYRKAVTTYDANGKRVAGAGTMDINGSPVVVWSDKITSNASFKSGFANFMRNIVGSTHGIGHRRSDGIDYQTTPSAYGKSGSAKLSTCIANGTMILATSTGTGFKASVPTNYSINTVMNGQITASINNTEMEAFWKQNKNDPTGFSYAICLGWESTEVKGLLTTSKNKETFLSETNFAAIDAVYLVAYNNAIGK